MAATSSGGGTGAGLILLVLMFVAYFLPAIVALSREHHRAGQVVVLNLFLGWTLLGWVVALVIAVGPVQPKAQLPRNIPRSETGAPPPPKAQLIDCWSCGTSISRNAIECWHCHAKPGDAPASEKTCQFCQGTIPASAIKCRLCGEWVVPESERPISA